MATLATGTPIDLPRLLETRLLVQANSGGGKSWALRRLLEQTADQVQQIVIDPEGEFSTLREKHDYIVCAAHDADAVAHPRTAKLLARRLLETGVSAVLDIYDLKPHERKAFVRHFLEAFVDAPKKLWHPVLIVLDEAHVFAPEKGSAESLGAVIDLATRGRKRGFCLCAATQRLSKLHKDVAAEMNNKMIGRTGLDIDIARAADEIGMTKREAAPQLRFLEDGEWFVFGPALSRSIEKIKVGPVQTTHPKVGERLISTPPAPSAKVRKILAELADLPQQAEEEARTLEDVTRQLAEARRKLKAAEKRAEGQGVPEAEVEKRVAAAVREALAARPVQQSGDTVRARKLLEQALGALGAPQSEGRAPPRARAAVRPARANGHDPVPPVSGNLGKGEHKVLIAVAQHSDGVDREQVTILTGYKRSTRDAYIQRLAAAGLVDVGPPITITEAGLAELPPDFKPLPTGEELRAHWLARLPAGEAAVLEVLVGAYPSGVSRDEITDVTEYKRSTRDAYIQRLGTRKLITIQHSEVFAHRQLFSEISTDA